MNSTEQRINAAALRLFAERGSIDVTMSELAAEARVARGTLYRNVDSVEGLFDQVIENLAHQMHEHIAKTLDNDGDDNPALRLALGTRMLVRLAQESRPTGNFIVRFGLTHNSLREVLAGPPMRDVVAGIETGVYDIDQTTELSVAGQLIGVTVSAMWLVLEGHQGWREAGSNAAEFLLRALGVPPAIARAHALAPLPDMPQI